MKARSSSNVSTKFCEYDPESYRLFDAAIERTAADRLTTPDERKTLLAVQELLATARIASGRRLGRSIFYTFEVASDDSNEIVTLQLDPGPNHRRRFCVIFCTADGRPVEVELTP
jgi:hypothetical protein